jgi:hypothetical protein
MLTDDTLTDLLRRSFADATETVTPAGDLAMAVRRRHLSAQRRRVAVRVGIPAVAAASVGAALALPHRSAHRAPVAVRSTAPIAITPSSVQPVSYRVAFPQDFGPVGCVARPSSGSVLTWLYADGKCAGQASAVIVTDTTLPADATPLTIGSLTGLYTRTDGDSRTVWARNADGGYTSLTVNAATPDAAIASFFTPAS